MRLNPRSRRGRPGADTARHRRSRGGFRPATSVEGRRSRTNYSQSRRAISSLSAAMPVVAPRGSWSPAGCGSLRAPLTLRVLVCDAEATGEPSGEDDDGDRPAHTGVQQEVEQRRDRSPSWSARAASSSTLSDASRCTRPLRPTPSHAHESARDGRFDLSEREVGNGAEVGEPADLAELARTSDEGERALAGLARLIRQAAPAMTPLSMKM